MKQATLHALLSYRTDLRPVVLATNLVTGEEGLIDPGDDRVIADLPAPVAEAVTGVLRSDKSTTVETDDGTLFLNVFNPPLRLIIVGAVHIAQPLARMGTLTGYRVTVIDPRSAFASEERFPDVTVLSEWPDDAMNEIKPDSRTAIVTLTHDPKIDDPALETALSSTAFYVGALGSKKTHAARLERLEKAGFNETQRERICGPVGLAIGAKSPSEIAVSILAQMTESLRQKYG